MLQRGWIKIWRAVADDIKCKWQHFHASHRHHAEIEICHLDEKAPLKIAKPASNGYKSSQSTQPYPNTCPFQLDLDFLPNDENIIHSLQNPFQAPEGIMFMLQKLVYIHILIFHSKKLCHSLLVFGKISVMKVGHNAMGCTYVLYRVRQQKPDAI